MATFEKPIWQDNAGTGVPSTYSAHADRTLIAALWPYAGVISSGDLAVTQRAAGADSSVDVAIGRAIVYQTGSDKAFFVNASGALQNVTLPASPGSNSRYDMIYAVVQDSTISGTVDNWSLVAVSGTAAASPVEPAAPSGAGVLLLARVTRTAGVATVLNAAIQDRRVVLRLPKSEASSPDNNVSAITATTPNNGATVCGVAFRAPASGVVHIGCNVHFQLTVSGSGSFGPQVRDGSTVGSGTVIFDPSADPGSKVSMNVLQLLAGDASATITGLTPGNMYNLCATVWASGGGGIMYFARRVWVHPQL